MTQGTKEKLQALMQELQERVEGIEKSLSQKHSADSAEQAVERENDDVLMGLKHEALEEIAQIRHALEMMDAGTYGFCEACGDEIQAGRLEIMPFVSLCVKCAEDLTR